MQGPIACQKLPSSFHNIVLLCYFLVCLLPKHFHLCQQLSVCLTYSCLIDPDNPRHLLIISQKEKNTNPHLLCTQRADFVFRFLVFLDPLKKDARGRHNIIGCTKVGHPLSFEESIYGVLEPWKLAPLHRELSRCSPAPSLALIRAMFLKGESVQWCSWCGRNIKCTNLYGEWTPSNMDGYYLKDVVRK